MRSHDATEQAYKNGYKQGYEDGKKDAVEVVHGRWVDILSWKFGWKCSECGWMVESRGNYCPNCGAKMDGDGNG